MADPPVASLSVIDTATGVAPNNQSVVWSFKVARGTIGGNGFSHLIRGVLADGTPILCDRSLGKPPSITRHLGGYYVTMPAARFTITALEPPP